MASTSLVRYGDLEVQRHVAPQEGIEQWGVFSSSTLSIDDVLAPFLGQSELGQAGRVNLAREFFLFGMLEGSDSRVYDSLIHQSSALGKRPQNMGQHNHNGGVTAVVDWDGTVYIRPDRRLGDRDFRYVLSQLGYRDGAFPIPNDGISERYEDERMHRVWTILSQIERQARDSGVALPNERGPRLPRIVAPGLFLIPGSVAAGEIVIPYSR